MKNLHLNGRGLINERTTELDGKIVNGFSNVNRTITKIKALGGNANRADLLDKVCELSLM